MEALTACLHGGREMLHEYEDMDPSYRSGLFLGRETLISTVKGNTLLPENGLRARTLLTDKQFDRMKSIRLRTLGKHLPRFDKD